jgi:hypothetical protein
MSTVIDKPCLRLPNRLHGVPCVYRKALTAFLAICRNALAAFLDVYRNGLTPFPVSPGTP